MIMIMASNATYVVTRLCVCGLPSTTPLLLHVYASPSTHRVYTNSSPSLSVFTRKSSSQ